MPRIVPNTYQVVNKYLLNEWMNIAFFILLILITFYFSYLFIHLSPRKTGHS